MSVQDSSAATGLIARVQGILLKPQAEFEKIETETTSAQSLIVGYVLPLVALSAICAFIGQSIFGVGAFGVNLKVPIPAAATTAVVQVVMTVVSVFVVSFIINALAPTFGSRADQAQAFKLAAYFPTAGWVAGVFTIFPPIAILAILGLYSFGLLYIGLPRLMKTPEDKRVGYFATIIIVCIVAYIIIAAITATATGMFWRGGMPGPGMHFGQTSSTNTNSSVTINGVTVDTNDVERAAQAMQQGAASNGGANVSSSTLAALLPQSIGGGFNKTASSDSSGGAMGMNMAQADATYENGSGARIQISVVSMGAMSGLGAMASAMNVQANEQTANGFSRTRSENGRTINEEQDNSAGTASVAIIGKNGAAVNVEGSGGVTADQARAIGMSLIDNAERAVAG